MKKQTFFYVALLTIAFFVTMALSYVAHGQHKKLRKIQKYMNEATADLAGVSVYIHSPKYGKWIGTSGYADVEDGIEMTKDHIYSMASIGKMYVAVAALQMASEGYFNINDLISKYLPSEIIENLPNAEQVTIRHLLGHSSGFANYEHDPQVNKLYISGQLKLDTLSHINALRRYLYGKPAKNAPGEKCYYSSSNYVLMAMIMDKVYPNGHTSYVREQLLQKYQLNRTTYRQEPSENYTNHYGDFNKDGTIEDITAQVTETTNWFIGDDGVYAPIDEAGLFLEKLVDGKILNEQYLSKMMTWNDDKNPDFGLGLEVDKAFPYKFLLGHSGSGLGNRMDLYYIPHQQMTIAIFSNTGLRVAHPKQRKAYYDMRTKIIKKLFLF